MKKGVLIAISLIFALTFMYFLNINPLGYVIYEPKEYFYNQSEIITDQGIRLKLIEDSYQTEIQQKTVPIIRAEENGKDKTYKVNEPYKQSEGVKPINKFIIWFSEELNNKNKISIYIQKSKNSTIWLCEEETICAYPGLGSAYYEFNGKYVMPIEIQINKLTKPTNKFRIRVYTNEDNKVRLDYIEAIKEETKLINNTQFPPQSSIETSDIKPINLGSWTSLEHKETLNGQKVEYFYSTDSGLTWKELITISGLKEKIKLKAILYSDGKQTPIIEHLKLNYEEVIEPCIENWECGNWSSCVNESQTRTCTDLNECKTENNKPAETRECQGEQLNQTEQNETQYNSTYFRTIQLKENVKLILNTTENITHVTFNLEDTNTTNQGIELEKLNIQPSEEIDGKIIEGYLEITYNTTNLDIDEDSLSLYYYNEDSEEWTKLNSELDKENNKILTKITHLSIFGLYGQSPSQNQEDSPPTSSSTGIRRTEGGSSAAAPPQKTSSASTEKGTVGVNPQQKEEIGIEEPQEEKEIIPKQSRFRINKNAFFGLVGIVIFILIYLIVKVEKKKKELKHEDF